MMLYYAHPIDQANESVDRIAYGSVRRDLLNEWEWVYDPAGAFSSTHGTYEPRVQDVNDIALLEADAVFALLPHGVPTIGTVTEIHKAAQAGKPVMVYCQTRPIGLGRMPENVHFWMADTAPGNRHADIRDASRALRARTEELLSQPIFLLPAERNGEATDDLSGSGIFCYSGPMGAERKYEGDAAWDVPASHRTLFDPHERKRVKTGVFIAPPDDVWVSMVGRSSNFERGLFVEPGVIDAGWRGELEVKVYNLSGDHVMIEAGERIAQLIPHKIQAQTLKPINVGGPESLPYGDRGTNGWGSTGR